MAVMTKNSKEYELIDGGNKDIAIVLFRSYGVTGYPDLHRHPGGPNGLNYMILQTPKCQVLKENSFDLVLTQYENYNGNRICQDYIQYVCPQLCFGGQHFDKSMYPISYLPTNPSEQRLPGSQSFLNMDELQDCLRSLMKERGYWLLRPCNSEIEPVSYDIIRNDEALVYTLTTLDHTIHKPLFNELEPLRRGEFRVVQMKRT